MIKGLYAAASAMVAGMKRQNALAHNIANLETPGFRQILLAMDDWYVTPVTHATNEIQPGVGVNHYYKPGYLGLGTQTSPEIIDFSQGDVKVTNEELDFAINGSGFFRLQTPDGVRYSRDGRFRRDANNTLVNVDGFKVLDVNGNAITLPQGHVRVDEQGRIFNQAGNQVAQINLAVFEDPQNQLERDGLNTFKASAEPTGTDGGSIQQGSLEMANANVQQLMTQMVIVNRAYEAAQKVVQMQDDIVGKLINNLNRL